MTSSQRSLGVLAAVALIGIPVGLSAQESPVLERRIQITLASPDTIYRASVRVGHPVVVSRADVESPKSRIRSLEAGDAGSESAASTPVADPAFKAVLLTPRASTGRPIQPQGIELASVDPAEALAPAQPSKADPGPSIRKAPAASKTKQQPKPKPTRLTKTSKGSSGGTQARPKGGSSPKFGRTAIEASRAFTRF
jgi:hypothetical protein